jgi:hypothetical protein
MKLFKDFLNEAKYEVEVEVRDASKANTIAKDMFRGSYKNNGSNSFVFKTEDDYDEFKDEMEKQGIALLESTLKEKDDSKNMKNKITKEVKLMRESLFESSNMLSRLANAMGDMDADKKDIKNIKEAEMHIDEARKSLFEVKNK